MAKNAYIVRHVAFEDLGNLSEVLEISGYNLVYFEAGTANLKLISRNQPELLIILGGPIGVYEEDIYPFLRVELDILKYRIEHDLPTLGICLGAQLIAKALGAKVYKGHAKEVGWNWINLTDAGQQNFFSCLKNDNLKVLHWHGDTFDLPEKALLMATSSLYPNQAFTYNKNILALQFHLEVTQQGVENWLIGHAVEIANTENISVLSLRQDTQINADIVQASARKFWTNWLSTVQCLRKEEYYEAQSI